MKMSKNLRQCNPLMTNVRDSVHRAYNLGYEQAKKDYKRLDGKWTREALGVKGVWYKCGNCQKYAIADYAFCPQCGSDMRGLDDEG